MINYLFLIPARAGSKGLPNKNTKELNGKPLIQYSIDFARKFTSDDNICVSTNDQNVINIATKLKLHIPFLRPDEFSHDSASADQVIRHAIEFYKSKNKIYDAVIYLQPTSPFRTLKQLTDLIRIFESGNYEMVVSVCVAKQNPYFSLFEENEKGFLTRSKDMSNEVLRRQDVPLVYQCNGSLYAMDVNTVLKKKLNEFSIIKKYQMESNYSIDIDTIHDWQYAEFLIQKKLIEFD